MRCLRRSIWCPGRWRRSGRPRPRVRAAAPGACDRLDVARAGLRFLGTAEAPAMTTAEQAACLRGLEKADAVATAARTSVLGAFGAGQGYADDGDYSARSWLEHRTQVTRGAS